MEKPEKVGQIEINIWLYCKHVSWTLSSESRTDCTTNNGSYFIFWKSESNKRASAVTKLR